MKDAAWFRQWAPHVRPQWHPIREISRSTKCFSCSSISSVAQGRDQWRVWQYFDSSIRFYWLKFMEDAWWISIEIRCSRAFHAALFQRRLTQSLRNVSIARSYILEVNPDSREFKKNFSRNSKRIQSSILSSLSDAKKILFVKSSKKNSFCIWTQNW